ncbi:MAG: peptidyl-prolyl cis-trans isomerase [Sphingobium sp.]
MMGFFRRMIKSKVGGLIGLLFLGMIALAFVGGDITNLTNGSLGQGGNAAEVGGAKLATTEVQTRVQRVYDANRREQPALTIGRFLDEGGFDGVVTQLIDGLALTEFGDDNGMRVSKKLVDAEIAAIPAFHDAAGKFSQTQFNQLLQRERISEAALREDIARQILERHLMGPAGANVVTPQGMTAQYASMLLERRSGTVAIVPSMAFVPTGKPDEAAVKRYYTLHGDRFALPEQRRMRYALVDVSRFAGKTQPSDGEIAQYYKANAAQYAASEKRVVSQLIVPTQAAATAIAAKVGPALSLERAANDAGLAATRLAAMNRTALAGQTDGNAAAAIFAAPKGKLVGPVRTGLGWALYAVEDIQATAARPLDSARAEIVTALTAEKTKQALSDLSAKIEDQIGDGATFDEVVKSNGLTAAQTPSLNSQGRSLDNPAAQPDPALQPVVTAGFAMEQGDDPQVVTVVPDQKLALVALGQIVPAGPPPFAQVRPLAERAWLISQGAAKAKAMADTLRTKIASGTPVATAVAGAGVKLPQPETVGAQRSQVGGQSGQVPEPLVALFSMKQGTVRVLPLPDDQGYLVLHLNKIIPGDAKGNQQILTATATGLTGVLSDEYGRQMVNAIRTSVGVKRNDAVLARVAADLRKGSAEQ